MKKKGLWIIVSALVVLGLLMGGFGCAAPSPEVTPTPTPAKPTPTPAKPGTTPAKPTPAPAPAAPEVIKWNMQTSYQFASSFSKYYAIDWVEWVKEITEGRLQIELHPPGTFAKGSEQLDALSKGTIDASLDYAGYYTSKVPISQIETGLPLAWNDGYQAYDAFYHRGLFELVQEAYGQFNVMHLGVACEGSSWYHFGTVFPFTGLDSIKGKKIRASGIYGKYVQALGGSPTVISGPDMYMSLKTGIIDGFIMGISTLKTYGLGEIANYYITDPTLTPLCSAAPTVNLDSWNKLPDDIKHLLQQTKYFDIMGAYNYKLEAWEVLRSAEKEYGMTWVTLSEADKKKAREVALPLWDEVAKSGPEVAKAVEIVKQQWRDWGFME